MFTRSLSVLATTLVAAGTLAVASAMATDEPAPLPQGVTKTRCIDNMRPSSRLSADWKRAFRRGVVRGIAIDQGCGAAGAGKVRSVSISIVRKAGKRCQSLLRNGRFGRVTSCRHVWLPAHGKKSWTFRLHHKLPRGTYMVSTRAVDSAGNVERRGR